MVSCVSADSSVTKVIYSPVTRHIGSAVMAVSCAAFVTAAPTQALLNELWPIINCGPKNCCQAFTVQANQLGNMEIAFIVVFFTGFSVVISNLMCKGKELKADRPESVPVYGSIQIPQRAVQAQGRSSDEEAHSPFSCHPANSPFVRIAQSPIITHVGTDGIAAAVGGFGTAMVLIYLINGLWDQVQCGNVTKPECCRVFEAQYDRIGNFQFAYFVLFLTSTFVLAGNLYCRKFRARVVNLETIPLNRSTPQQASTLALEQGHPTQ